VYQAHTRAAEARGARLLYRSRTYSLLAEPEGGLGVRFGSLSLDAVFQFSLTRFNQFDSDGSQVGKPVGIIFSAGWSLPRNAAR
jgi:hypothetical protein